MVARGQDHGLHQERSQKVCVPLMERCLQVDLLLFYTPLGLGRLGESWTAWSFLQAAGCASA